MQQADFSLSETEALNEGFEAAFSGADEFMDNPHDRGSTEFLSWNDGFHNFFEQMDKQASEASSRLKQESTDPLLAKLRAMSAAQVADLIQLPLDQWPGKCFAVASMLVKALGWVDAQAIYGLYLGPVSPGSALFANKQGAIRHGWVITREGVLVDPTWWVFLAADPQVRILAPGTNEHYDNACEYDEGAECLSEVSRLGWPEAKRGDKLFRLTGEELLHAVSSQVQRHTPFQVVGPGFTMQQLSWVCRTRYSYWGQNMAKSLYDQVDAHGHAAVVPLDFRQRACRETLWGTRCG